MQLEDLEQQQLGDLGRRLEAVRRDERRLLHRVVDARPDPVPRRTVRWPDHEHRWQRTQAGIEERVVADQVAADQVGGGAAFAMPDHRHPLPGRRVDEGAHGHALCRVGATHPLVAAVRQHDDVSCVRPVPFARSVSIHARPRATTWNRVTRRAPGARTATASCGGSDS